MINRTSMSDVARRAGVSKATVSHVINATRFVEDETRQRVLDAIRVLGYRPNILARSLTTKRTGIIGMLISDSSNYFFGEILKSVEEVLLPLNYGLIVCNSNETLEREAHYLNLLLGLNVDGIIAAATSQQWDALSEAEIHHTPIVFVDRTFETRRGSFVGVNNAQGAALGTRHLVACGYQRIGCLAGFERLSSMRERVEGYRQALQASQLAVREDWIVPSELSIEGGRAAMRRLLALPDRPGAVFINNNLLLIGALHVLREMDLRCPQDIALLCFDDPPWAAIADPPISVVRQPAGMIGQIAAEMLVARIQKGPLPQPDVILDCELVIRHSC